VADNRRSSTRFDVDLEARVQVAHAPAPEPCRVKNISMGGLLVSITRLPMGQRLTVWFRVPTLEAEIEAAGVVRWSTDDAVGMQFDGLRAKETWALGKYIEQLQDS